jgi:hypothetical protein
MRDEAEQLEFVGIERHARGLVARMRNIDNGRDGSEWLADLALLEVRYAHLPRGGATKAALDALKKAIADEVEEL